MATTTNYGWTTPDDTSLVKDGASAIRSLGSSIDTTTKNLNPSTTLGDIEYRSATANTNTRVPIGTSGQALTVVAGVPSWAASPTSVLTTTGDLLYASAANTLARRAIGSTGDVLTVSGGLPTWAAPSSGGFTSLATGSLSTTSTSITSIPSGYRSLRLVINNMQSTAGNFNFTFNSDTGTNYGFNVLKGGTTQYADQANFFADQSTPTSALNASMILDIFEYTLAFQKNFAFYGGRGDATNVFTSAFGIWNNTAALTSIQINNSSNFTGGTYTLYGVK